jgi:hypothetical protein
MKAAGDLAPNKFQSYKGNVPVLCKNGLAAVVPGDPLYTFRCDNVSEQPRPPCMRKIRC